jgi:hypothetical protein
MDDDPELEAYLRQFRPLTPLPLVRPSRRRWIAVGGALAASIAVLVFAWRTAGPRPREGAKTASWSERPSMGTFARAVRAGGLDIALDAWDERVLPNPQRDGGALRVLADVGRDRGTRMGDPK